MELSTSHLACFTMQFRLVGNQLKPDQSSCSAWDKIGIAWLIASLLLWTSTREVVQDRSEWTKALC